MRLVNRLLAFVVALALAAAGIITIVEVIGERAASSGPVIIDWKAMLRWGQRNTWQALSVEITCGVLAAVGLVLLVLQLRRRRPSTVPLQSGDQISLALTRKGMSNVVRAAALDVQGISKAKVKIKRHRVVVTANSAAATAAEAKSFTDPVNDAVKARLDALQPQGRRRVRVRVRGRSERGDE